MSTIAELRSTLHRVPLVRPWGPDTTHIHVVVTRLTTSDGRKYKLKVPGLTPPVKPGRTEERGSEEPPRADPRPPVNPDVAGF